MFSSSLKWRNPENDNKQAVAKRMSDSELVLVALSAILASNSTDTGVFFVTGLANNLYNPSKVVCTNRHDVGEDKSDEEWIHVSALKVSSTAAFDLVVPPNVADIKLPYSPWLGETQNYVLKPMLPISEMPPSTSSLSYLLYSASLCLEAWLPTFAALGSSTSSSQSRYLPMSLL